jgi:hypothetical protein
LESITPKSPKSPLDPCTRIVAKEIGIKFANVMNEIIQKQGPNKEELFRRVQQGQNQKLVKSKSFEILFKSTEGLPTSSKKISRDTSGSAQTTGPLWAILWRFLKVGARLISGYKVN